MTMISLVCIVLFFINFFLSHFTTNPTSSLHVLALARVAALSILGAHQELVLDHSSSKYYYKVGFRPPR